MRRKARPLSGAKLLQQQKRSKQRQQLAQGPSPAFFDIPQQLQGQGQKLQGGQDEDGRSYQLVGMDPVDANAVNTTYRRSRDGGVLVPLRMMASLLISGAAGGAAPALADGAGAAAQATGQDGGMAGEQQRLEQPQLQQQWQQLQQQWQQQRAELGTAPGAGRMEEDEDDGDGAMLIDVGSADRIAEGALLPTPERPRSSTAGAGWDALRGFGLGPDADACGGGGGGGGSGGIAAALALLSTGEGDVGRSPAPGWQQRPEQQQQQRQELLEEVGMEEEAQADQTGQLGAPGRGGLAADGAARPAEEADGFDADDEGEDAQAERGQRAARLRGRSSIVRPLPGLACPPPWSSLGSEQPSMNRLGLASFSALSLAQGGAAPASAAWQAQAQAGQLPAASAGSQPLQADADPTLEDLLKLKCSLRRAVAGSSSQALGLVLSLLAALPVSPQSLAASQVAALVSPLQHHSCTQVSAAARHLVVVWKAVLKAAARHPGPSAQPSFTLGSFDRSGCAVPRPVLPSLALSPLGDPAVGFASDDQRRLQPHAPQQPPGAKSAPRPSLLGSHAPLTKRQRHQGGGSQHSGGHHTASKVRRMSLLLGSLDLGGGGGDGGGGGAGWDGDDAGGPLSVELEQDADAEADMGSQDDDAMLTSDDDSPNGASWGNGSGSANAAAPAHKTQGTGRDLGPSPMPHGGYLSGSGTADGSGGSNSQLAAGSTGSGFDGSARPTATAWQPASIDVTGFGQPAMNTPGFQAPIRAGDVVRAAGAAGAGLWPQAPAPGGLQRHGPVAGSAPAPALGKMRSRVLGGM
ncbi:hypothetical protein GPECTOR_75g754 [Gonium pectorale]|uniref:TFIIS N-terminal domain-containing protein n=1 Tax=Gonium pectorale TaxID=33097 RepID=A0A150G407_GONPE|nr:hypothetical protein GPECTOR_75g754 [Gonium pectorale]|eukprot:KXZ44030.1 hypothetical protein GPECTOR_75g754 [Gonium pectorale]